MGGGSPFSSGPSNPFAGMGGADFMDVDDAPGSPFGSGSPFGTNIFGSRGGTRPRPQRSSSFDSRSRPSRAPTSDSPKPPDIIRPLKVTLEELFSGTTKRLKVSKKMLDGSTQEKILDIEVCTFVIIYVPM